MLQNISRIIKFLGFDRLTLLIKGLPPPKGPPLDKAEPPFPTDFKEIQTKFSHLPEGAELTDAIEYCTGLLKREEDRERIVESKAFSLIGNTAITVTLVIGFGGLMLNEKIKFDLIVFFLLVFLSIAAILSFVISILLALRAVRIEVAEYRSTYPAARDIFDLAKQSLHSVKLERVASLFFSFTRNHEMVNRKATYLSGAQLWFRNSVVLLLAVGLVFIIALSRMPRGTVPHTPCYFPTGRLTATPTNTPPAFPQRSKGLVKSSMEQVGSKGSKERQRAPASCFALKKEK